MLTVRKNSNGNPFSGNVHLRAAHDFHDLNRTKKMLARGLYRSGILEQGKIKG